MLKITLYNPVTVANGNVEKQNIAGNELNIVTPPKMISALLISHYIPSHLIKKDVATEKM